ncbi:hypothetical protein BDF21DRAFT_454009 [Thamnidium elegans]|uniref:UspA domain-containing protein n=1 Tax=Thamnidium elegans TaxID=101142 RepID=A0A8H7VVL9_9FUNG|nr:hypothetical protein INT48_003596 [Thamnidium elegans]KAI8071858.1 hypothetical protein BDF21DRAFT_454009 [Thamnidium elegans]
MPRQIAFAIDPSSEEAIKTIQWSIENFLKPNDEIHTIMVIELDSEFESPELPPTDSFESIEKELMQEKLVAMESVVKKLSDAGFKVKQHVFKTYGTQAYDLLINYLDTETMDCLIMGSRNLSAWKRFFVGSFSDYVQSHVHCPVLIVK